MRLGSAKYTPGIHTERRLQLSQWTMSDEKAQAAALSGCRAGVPLAGPCSLSSAEPLGLILNTPSPPCGFPDACASTVSVSSVPRGPLASSSGCWD